MEHEQPFAPLDRAATRPGDDWRSALVDWPAQETERRRREAARLPVLLVLATGIEPPWPLGELEDWVRSPIDDVEVAARWRALEDRRLRRTFGLVLDDDGLLRFAGRWIALSHLEEATIRPLVLDVGRSVAGEVVRQAYGAAGGPPIDGVPPPIGRLRRKVARLPVLPCSYSSQSSVA